MKTTLIERVTVWLTGTLVLDMLCAPLWRLLAATACATLALLVPELLFALFTRGYRSARATFFWPPATPCWRAALGVDRLACVSGGRALAAVQNPRMGTDSILHDVWPPCMLQGGLYIGGAWCYAKKRLIM